jgi:hypothetical protein
MSKAGKARPVEDPEGVQLRVERNRGAKCELQIAAKSPFVLAVYPSNGILKQLSSIGQI